MKMITGKQLNSLEKFSPGSGEYMDFSDELMVDIGELTALDTMAGNDQGLGCLWESRTPFGFFHSMKHEIIRYLHWLLIFRSFQRGASLSFEEEIYCDYPRQDPWYLIVGEHDQMHCLVSEVRASGQVEPTRYRSNEHSKKTAYSNIERFVVNLQVERLCGEYLNWLSGTGEFDSYLDRLSAIDFTKIEQMIKGELLKHYGSAIESKTEIGGVQFEWTGGHYNKEAYGQGFCYSAPLR